MRILRISMCLCLLAIAGAGCTIEWMQVRDKPPSKTDAESTAKFEAYQAKAEKEQAEQNEKAEKERLAEHDKINAMRLNLFEELKRGPITMDDWRFFLNRFDGESGYSESDILKMFGKPNQTWGNSMGWIYEGRAKDRITGGKKDLHIWFKNGVVDKVD